MGIPTVENWCRAVLATLSSNVREFIGNDLKSTAKNVGDVMRTSRELRAADEREAAYAVAEICTL
jgi:hypothetical protein